MLTYKSYRVNYRTCIKQDRNGSFMYIIKWIMMLSIQFCDCDLSRDSLKHFTAKKKVFTDSCTQPLHSRWEIGVSPCSLAPDTMLHHLKTPLLMSWIS